MANSNYKKYKKKSVDAKKIAVGVGAVLLAGLLTAGVCCTGYASRNADGKWFKNSDLATWHWSDKVGDMGDTGDGGETENPPVDKEPEAVDLIFNEDETESPLKVTINRLAPLMADAPMAIDENHKSYLVTAKCTPEDTTDTIDMSIAWASACENDISQYVQLDHESGSKTATVTMLQDFTTTINLTVKVHQRDISKVVKIDDFVADNEDIYAYKTFRRGEDSDYKQIVVTRTSDTSGEFGFSMQNFDDRMRYELGFYCDGFYGSIAPSRVEAEVTYSCFDKIKQALPSYQFKETTAHISGVKVPSANDDAGSYESKLHNTFCTYGNVRDNVFLIPIFEADKPDSIKFLEYKDDGVKFLQYIYDGDKIEQLQRDLSLIRGRSDLPRTENDILAIMSVDITYKYYIQTAGQEVLALTGTSNMWVGFQNISHWEVPASDVNPGDDLVFY